VQSIERAFSILRTLARGPAGVTDLADRTDLPKSTVSRLLAALESQGAVEQAGVGGEYSIGPGLATLGAAAGPTADLRSIARPFIEELALATGGSAGFTVLDGRDAFWVDNVDPGDEVVTLADLSGQSFPLHTIASGLAMLSKSGSAAIHEYVDQVLEASSGETAADPDDLRARLGQISGDGLVVSREELDPGVNAFAVPFRGVSGEWDAALYVQGPAFRFPGPTSEKIVIELLRESAAELTERLVGL